MIINCGWLLTVNPANEVLQDHSLIVTAGLIEAILPTEKAAETYQSPQVLQRQRHIVAPGLINAHTHLAMNLLRGFADDMPLMPWLQEKIWPAEQLHCGPEFVVAGTRLALAESIRGGVTTVNDMYFFPDRVAQQLENASMRGHVGLLVIDFPSAWAKDADSYFKRGIELHDALRHSKLVSTCFAPHSPYAVSRQHLEKVVMLSTEMDVPIHMHIHETADEVEQFESTHGQRPLAMLEEIGLLGPSLIAVHMTQLNEEERDKVEHYGMHVAHCPESNMQLASGTAPVAALQAAGCNIAIGTDGAASNNDLDLLGEIQTAALQAKLASRDARALGTHDLLRMATINGAKALGIDTITGSLEPGKAADIICINTDTPEMQPLHDPVSQLIYTACRDAVNDVWVNGVQLMQDRELLTIDVTAAIADARQWTGKLQNSTH